MPSDPGHDPRVYLAVERTLLAWIRTGLALMGFGFVIARLAFFLREIAVVHPGGAAPRPGLSLWIGTALILLGVVVDVGAAVEHVRAMRRLERGEAWTGGRTVWALALAIALAALGLALAGYLLRL
jgi:putative membrane protein